MTGAGKILPWLYIFLWPVSFLCASPIRFPVDQRIFTNPMIPKDFCILPPDYGTQGTVKFIAECDSLDQYTYLPIPGQVYQKFGTHPVVCWPKKIYKDDFICFPSDAWCPIYKKVEYNIPEIFKNSSIIPEYDTPTYGKPMTSKVIKMADRTCSNTSIEDGKVLSNCVTINRCSQLLKYPNAPAN